MGSSKSSTNSTPWSGQQPALRRIFGEAEHLYDRGQGSQYYPGQTVAGFSDPTQAGFGQLMNRGMHGTQTQDSLGGFINTALDNRTGTDALTQTARGGFLGSNPYLDQTYQHAAGQITDSFKNEIMPSLNASFAGAGRSGSGIQAQMAGDAAQGAMDSLGGLGAQIYAPAYEAERDRMMSAADGLNAHQARAGAMAPQYDGMQRNNISDMLSVGHAVDNKAQQYIDSDMNRYNFEQQAPWQNLNNFSNAVYGLPGGYGAQTSSNSPSAGQRIAGGAGGYMLAMSNPATAPFAPLLGLAGLL